MTYGDYFDLAQAETRSPADSVVRAARTQYASFLASRGVADSASARWFATPMRAVRDASPVGLRFPLIVIVHGNGQSAVDQALLAEHLAASGYVVATSPSYTRISGPPASSRELGTGAEEQADDIALIVGAVRERTDVNDTLLGVVAHSLGARGALLYTMRNPAVQALVSLDGGIGTATGRKELEESPSFDPRRLRAPLLHLFETLDAFMARDFTLLSSLSGAEVLAARIPFMHHQHFTDLGAWSARVPGLMAASGASAQTPGMHRVMMDLIRSFLDTHVRGIDSAFNNARMRAARGSANAPAIEFSTLRGPSRNRPGR